MKRDLTEELLALLPEADREVYRAVTRYIEGLGYRPKKQSVANFTLSYAHEKSGKVIAKLRVVKGDPVLAVKFFGVRDVPQRYRDALVQDIESREGQYSGPVRNPDDKARCDCCPACTGGGLGYYAVRRDGTEVVRCGAYPIPIPRVGEGELEELMGVLREQHEYFETLGSARR